MSEFLTGLIRDPSTDDPSSARLIALGLASGGLYIALLLVTVACYVALRARDGDAEIVKALISTAAAAIIASLIANGAVALLTRKKAPDDCEVTDEIVDEPSDMPNEGL